MSTPQPISRYEQSKGAFTFRPFEVQAARHLTPHMIRVTFRSPLLDEVVSLGSDDDIRIQFPEDFDVTPLPPVVHFDPFRLEYPENAPPSQIRAYTIRQIDHETGELNVDFVVHGEGIATRWAEQARPGQHVNIGGPRGSRVFDVHPPHHLYIGDATSLPAVGRSLECLPAGTSAHVIVEIDGPEDEQTWNLRAGVSLKTTWIYRGDTPPGNSDQLVDIVRSLKPPLLPCFVFGAGESATMRTLRRIVVSDWGFDTSYVNFSGYWKRPDDSEQLP